MGHLKTRSRDVFQHGTAADTAEMAQEWLEMKLNLWSKDF